MRDDKRLEIHALAIAADDEKATEFLKTVFERMPPTAAELADMISGFESIQAASVCNTLANAGNREVSGKMLYALIARATGPKPAMLAMQWGVVFGWYTSHGCNCGQKYCTSGNLRLTARGREVVAIFRGMLSEGS